MKLPLPLFALACICAAACGAALAGEPVASKVLPLWPTGNPEGWSVEGEEIREEDGDLVRIRNVNHPDADEVSCRPDFTALIYPAYLVAGKDDPALAPELPVGGETPPVFFAHTGDDHVPAESSIYFYLALRKAGVPAELHLYPKGGHGYGLRNQTGQIRFWPERMLEWMRSLPASSIEN
ncbi:MAG TPA: prolyl oligopeptidase family serine peptidase [Verrucomicrobiales bacterium]|nr:prolyl oligopeptidase family serine peptidase [Verrucomicrobiales bacterium]